MQNNNTKTKAKGTGLKLVEVHGKQLLTSSIVISESTGRDHKDIMALAKKHKNDLLEVGHITFQTNVVARKQGGGTNQEIAYFDDYAAILLMTHMRSTGVVAEFKKRLVQEFKWMRKILSDPDRKEALQYKRDTAKPMTDMLMFIRETVGKKTSGVPHCSNEMLFCNRALTGKYEPIDEANDLDAYDAKLLGIIRQHNTLLMTRHLKQSDRKKLMDEFVANYRYKNQKQELLEAAS